MPGAQHCDDRATDLSQTGAWNWRTTCPTWPPTLTRYELTIHGTHHKVRVVLLLAGSAEV